VDHSKVEAVVPFKNVELKVRNDIGCQHWIDAVQQQEHATCLKTASRHHARLLLALTPLLIRSDSLW
jgi:hypothetical protein